MPHAECAVTTTTAVSSPVALPAFAPPNPAASFDTLFSSDTRHIRPVKGADKERVIAWLDEQGVDIFLEHIASGFLPIELAVANKLPITVFSEWLLRAAGPERMLAAEKSCAEAFMVKAILPLTVRPSGAAEAMVNVKLSDVMKTIAERMDPEKWAGKAVAMKDGDTNNLLVINMQTGQPRSIAHEKVIEAQLGPKSTVRKFVDGKVEDDFIRVSPKSRIIPLLDRAR